MIGPLSYGDILLIVLALISGTLALYRGLTREILSLVAWAGAAGAAYFVVTTQQAMTADMAGKFGIPPIVVTVGAAAITFLIVLIIMHLITMRISDAILDRQLGMVDRILGLFFGIGRAYLLVVIPYMLYHAFFPNPANQYAWISQSQSIGYVRSTGEALNHILLPFAEKWSNPDNEADAGSGAPGTF